MKHHYLALMLLSASTGLVSAAQADTSNTYDQDHQIQGTNAGGEKQTTVIDNNGNLKVVPKNQQPQAPQNNNRNTDSASPDVSPNNVQPDLNETSPGMSQGMPTPSMQPQQPIINQPNQPMPNAPGQAINPPVPQPNTPNGSQPAVQNPGNNNAGQPTMMQPAVPNQAPSSNQAGQPTMNQPAPITSNSYPR